MLPLHEYLPKVTIFVFFIVFSSSVVVYTSPTGIHTNWLPSVGFVVSPVVSSLTFPALTSSITIPSGTVSASVVILNPAGTIIVFPYASSTGVFLSALNTVPCESVTFNASVTSGSAGSVGSLDSPPFPSIV